MRAGTSNKKFFYMALCGKYKNIPVTIHAILMAPDGAKTIQRIFIKLLHLKYCSRGSQIVEGLQIWKGGADKKLEG